MPMPSSIAAVNPKITSGPSTTRMVSAMISESEVTMVRDSVSFTDRSSSAYMSILRYLRIFSRIRS